MILIIKRYFYLYKYEKRNNTVCSCVVFWSCKKYPGGPGISLRPKKWRLSGSWQVEQLLVNGQDMTSAYFPNRSYFESYEVGGAFGCSTATLEETGTWRWVQHKTKIFRVPSYNNSDGTITILRLENKSFWYSYDAGGQSYEMHMVQD
ncbi:MAG TPA: hypothetical protein VI112_10595 [Bacteroidia bacterium]|jgi:hypothetical protein